MKVKVCNATYTVRWMTAAEVALSSVAGFCANELQVIAINPAHGAEVQHMTLMHELLHAAFYAAGLDDGLTEEKVCRSLEGPLLQVIRDNPLLMAVLAKGKPLVL